MAKIIKSLLLAVFWSVLFCSSLAAQVINAASCNAGDVQNAFNSVTALTTTVNIPAGTCHWTTQVTLTVTSGSTTLSVLGAGSLSTVGGGDVTNIVDDYASGSPVLQITTGVASSNFRMAGLTVKGGTGSQKYNGVVSFAGFSQNFRLDHFHFNPTTYTGTASTVIKWVNWIYGVADHNIFDGASGPTIWYDAYNGIGYGDGSWADPSGFGSNKFMFFEDNQFNYSGSPGGALMSDCSNGGRFVVRHNTMAGGNGPGIDMHPTGGSGRIRGCRAVEIYGNSFSASAGQPTYTVFWYDSGTALVWGNTTTVGFENFIALYSVRSDNSIYTQTGTPNGWGYCGTAFNGTGSCWDGNNPLSSGYACLDNPGRGQGDLLSGNFPNVIDSVTSTCTWPNQASEPMYEWSNIWSPWGYGTSTVSNSNPSVLAANRDYYQYTSSFSGTSGTGSGTLAARPAICTPSVAYWATDTNTLYQCTATNTWIAYYTPYTYPHPLTQGQGPPAPPSNLQAIPQ